MDKLFDWLWPRDDDLSTSKSNTLVAEATESILSLARSKASSAIRTAISFLNDTVYTLGLNSDLALPSATTVSPPLYTTTANTIIASRHTLAISSLLATAVTATIPTYNTTTVAVAADTFNTNYTFLNTRDFTEDELLNSGDWNNTFSSSYYSNFTDVYTNTTFWNDSSISIINATLLATAIITTTTTTEKPSEANQDETTWQCLEAVIKSIVLGLVILATIIGNVFVIAAILLERNLQSVANHLILSLAVADLLVACLVMPLGAVYEISQKWEMGPELCELWTASDVLCCTSSILHLVIIALDRYWAVTNIDYVHQRTGRRIGIMISIVWIFSFSVSILPMLGWKDPDWKTRVDNMQCLVSQDVYYQIFATASSFYVPLLVILVLYWRIFQTARKRIRRRQQVTAAGAETSQQGSDTANNLIANAARGSGGIAAAVVTIIGRPLPTISETTTAFTNVSSTNTSPEKNSCANGVDRIENDPMTNDISIAYPSTATSIMQPSKSVARKKQQVDSKRERKAAKTLAIITGAFVCCWLPFFVVAILLPTCTECHIPPIVVSIFLWLGYFNSTLNPIIYTIFSPEFRHAFKRLLCGRRNSIRRRTGVRR